MKEVEAIAEKQTKPKAVALPKIGFLGVGWIGRSRMEAVKKAGLASEIVVCDPVAANVEAAVTSGAGKNFDSFEEMLKEVDAVVIATPSALHAKQSMKALAAGKAVFCQKPLGRNNAEVREIITAARKADRLLGVDYSYRYTNGMQHLKKMVAAGELGQIFSIETVFHNAYGPDKAWFYNPELSGGGCLTDLGSHLIDLALWILDFPAAEVCHTEIYAGGRARPDVTEVVEDFATAQLRTYEDVSINLACTWNASLGKDADISFRILGTKGGAAFYNVNGSFYDFESALYRGTSKQVLSVPPEDWGGAAICRWAKQLAQSNRYNKEAEEFIKSSLVLDEIYQYRPQ